MAKHDNERKYFIELGEYYGHTPLHKAKGRSNLITELTYR